MTWVLLHATGHNSGLWSGKLPALCLDLPGHGTAARVSPPRVEGYAEALADAVPEGAVLIGHSLGGMVAAELARRAATRARALVLLDAPIRLPFDAFPKALEMMTEITTPDRFSRVAGPGVRDAALKTAIQDAVKAMSPGGLRDAALAAGHYDARPALRAMDCPVLGIFGRMSPIAGPIAARMMRSARPDAACQMVPGGHMFPLEDPGDIAERIEQFLETHP